MVVPQPETRRRAVRTWLLAVAALIFAMVLVGGATRVTESGLSIVEWKPLTGWIPPLSAAEWQAEFAKYQATSQFQRMNSSMTLGEFELIYWWEWTHRVLGRLIAIAFLVPFLWFLWKGWIGSGLRGRLWTIFGFGAFEGAVGWWMVASGLVDRVNVSQYRLAFHLTLASAIFAMIVWTAQRLLPQPAPTAPPRLRASALGLIVLVLCQIYLGALVAGLRAGLLYNTWPLIDGSLVPAASDLFFNEPWWRNFFENPLTVQFVHRTFGYFLWVAAVAHAIDAVRTGRGGAALSLTLAAAVTIQAAIGIGTVLHQVPIGLALLHQGMAVVVLALAVVHAERLVPRRHIAPVGAPVADAA